MWIHMELILRLSKKNLAGLPELTFHSLHWTDSIHFRTNRTHAVDIVLENGLVPLLRENKRHVSHRATEATGFELPHACFSLGLYTGNRNPRTGSTTQIAHRRNIRHSRILFFQFRPEIANILKLYSFFISHFTLHNSQLCLNSFLFRHSIYLSIILTLPGFFSSTHAKY